MKHRERVRRAVSGSQQAVGSLLLDRNYHYLVWAGREIARTHRDGGVTWVCGNGGSAAQAEHLVGELMGFLRTASHERTAIRAAALTSPSASVTCVANDEGVASIFSRQLSCATCADFLIALSTSGTSGNVAGAMAAAMDTPIPSLLITGAKMGEVRRVRQKLERFEDRGVRSVVIDSSETPHIQEATLVALHLIAEFAEEAMKEA